MTEKCPHADNMRLYAEDAANHEEPWTLWELGHPDCPMSLESHPMWEPSTDYRRKPRTITINGYILAEPLRIAPEIGTEYYLANVLIALRHPQVWTNYDSEKLWLEAGLVHLRKEDAAQHREALLSFTKAKS